MPAPAVVAQERFEQLRDVGVIHRLQIVDGGEKS